MKYKLLKMKNLLKFQIDKAQGDKRRERKRKEKGKG